MCAASLSFYVADALRFPPPLPAPGNAVLFIFDDRHAKVKSRSEIPPLPADAARSGVKMHIVK